VELRQLRYFVTLAEECHFGRAAAREHIVQSALSQQIQRLERELGVELVERSTHHVRLTAAGDAFLFETRQILGHIERATTAARTATRVTSTIRAAMGDASYDTMPLILGAVRKHHPALEIHQIEAGVPKQYRLLAEGRVDVGIGRAAHAPAAVASEVIRVDPVGMLVGDGHRFARLDSIPVTHLIDEPLLFAAEGRAPEFNDFVGELCRTAGFTPRAYRGTVHSVRCGADLVRELRCLLCVPRSCGPMSGIRWVPLGPPAFYPWSLLWRAGAETETAPVRSVLRCARVLSATLGWTHVYDDSACLSMVATR
jgi:DNA-binding transcriptional LysR family regulator